MRLGVRVLRRRATKGPADQAVEASGSRSWVRHEPMGTVLAIMPWNFPYWQVFRFAAPALMAGNAGMLKHSPNVSGSPWTSRRSSMTPGCPPASSAPSSSPNQTSRPRSTD